MQTSGLCQTEFHDLDIGLHESLVKFFPEGHRPTVGFAFTCANSLLLAQCQKGPTWGLPQEGVEFLSEKTIMEVLIRGGRQELGFHPDYISYAGHTPKSLFGFANPIPPERGMKYKYKKIVLVSVPARTRMWVRPGSEIRNIAWVNSMQELLARLHENSERRPVKFEAICRTVNKLHALGLLTWSCTGDFSSKVVH